ncbi:hypothetical protein SCORR_v1c07030 [Spiroplasma corruscae]|uniref:Uncharacterized protein n=1 Tax=Spiroplasma corruscae TaxID=216934 RepID=A0A222EPJ7_9MOLU|nr:hypothetical protein [Spiroplasma corruscae]ASP28475.1 hypothetical protein SCORR_v1c07030 [Spiroplasma corruscae]
MSNTNKNEMNNVAYKLMIISTVFLGFFIIPLAWMIPMTIATKSRITEKKDSISLGICCILFCGTLGLVAGILLLIENSN